jgi:hypothetical protein
MGIVVVSIVVFAVVVPTLVANVYHPLVLIAIR